MSTTTLSVPRRVADVDAELARGIGAMLLTCALWATTFVAPLALAATGGLALAGGRYVVFGAVAALAWRRLRPDADVRIPWGRAAFHALAGNVGYYVLTVFAVRLAGAAPTIAVVGTTPVVYAVASARRDGASLHGMRGPLTVMAAGLALVHLPELVEPGGGIGGAAGLTGLLLATASVLVWLVYGLDNARFLGANRDVTPATWTAAVGMLTGAMGLPLLLVGLHVDGGMPDGAVFVAVAVCLGLLPSWVGSRAWSEASLRLPGTLLGQLLVLELVFGLTYSHALAWEAPGLVVGAGYVAMVVGVVRAMAASQPRARSAEREVAPPRDG